MSDMLVSRFLVNVITKLTSLENRPNTSQVANAINSGRGLP